MACPPDIGMPPGTALAGPDPFPPPAPPAAPAPLLSRPEPLPLADTAPTGRSRSRETWAASVKMGVLIGFDRPAEAMILFREQMARLGLEFLTGEPVPGSPPLDDELRDMASRIETGSIFPRLPMVSDEDAAAGLALLAAAMPAAWRLSSDLYARLVLNSIRVSLAFGIAPASTWGFLRMGGLMAGRLGDHANGHATAVRALRFSRLFRDRNLFARLKYVFAIQAAHWGGPLASVPRLMSAAEAKASPESREADWRRILTGLFRGKDMAGLAGMPDVVPAGSAVGSAVGSVVGSVDEYAPPSDRDRLLLAACRRAARSLAGLGNFGSLNDQDFDEASALELTFHRFSPATRAELLFCILVVRHAAGRYEEALAAADEILTLGVLTGTLEELETVFLRTLCLAALHDLTPEVERTAVRIRLEQGVRRLGALAAAGHREYEARLLLARAELLRTGGDPADMAQVVSLYDAALRAAAETRSSLLSALTASRAANFHRAGGREIIAEAYLAQARRACLECGAAGLASHLDTGFDGQPLPNDPESSAGGGLLAACALPPSTEELIRLNRELRNEIRKRRRAEEHYRQAEKRYRSIFENSIEGMYRAGPDGRLIDVNPAMARIFGFDAPAQLTSSFATGRGFYEDPGRRAEFLARVLEQGEVKEFESRILRKDGRAIWISENARIMSGDSAESIHFAGSVQDITRRKEAELELLRLAGVVEQTPQSIVLTDPSFFITYVNGSFETMTGVGRDEAVGMNVSRLFDRDDTPDAFLAMVTALKDNGGWTGRTRLRRPGGTPLSKETSAFPIRDETGEIISYCFVERDVTHEVKLEAQLRQSKKMEAMGTLAGGIAHDFNNLLAGIMACIEMAIDAADGNEEALFELGEALKACGYAKDMVRQILAFSRKGNSDKRPLAVGPVLKEAVFLIRSGTHGNIEAELSIQAERDVILGDPSQISQLVMNLCTNAVQAMQPKGGRLKVTLSSVCLSEREARLHPGLKAGEYLSLAVADTGHGMDSELMERIFDPFFTTRRRGEGVGLGLSVVHGIVNELGGQISAESEPGRGSVFTVLIPAAEGRAFEAPRQIGTDPQGNERILCVDDEALLAAALRRLLEGLGYRVTACGLGAEAAQLFRQDPSAFDLVITDLTMPGMDGMDLTAELKAVRPDLPVILCTGYAEALERDNLENLGVSAILSKPFQKNVVATTIRHVLDQLQGN